jgi:hypothetical protein
MSNRRDIELGLEADIEQPYMPTLTASATTTLTKWYPVIGLKLQASGTSVLKLASAEIWAGKQTKLSVVIDGGGECQLLDSLGNDILGDNFGAITDYAIVESVDGKIVAVVKEVTS